MGFCELAPSIGIRQDWPRTGSAACALDLPGGHSTNPRMDTERLIRAVRSVTGTVCQMTAETRDLLLIVGRRGARTRGIIRAQATNPRALYADNDR